MVGTKVAPVSGLMAALRQGLLQPAMRWLEELDTVTPAGQLSDAKTERAWFGQAEPDHTDRDLGATPLRGLRLS